MTNTIYDKIASDIYDIVDGGQDEQHKAEKVTDIMEFLDYRLDCQDHCNCTTESLAGDYKTACANQKAYEMEPYGLDSYLQDKTPYRPYTLSHY